LTIEELTNKALLTLYIQSILAKEDLHYIRELREEILDRMGGDEGE
jgi:hypothetical protein